MTAYSKQLFIFSLNGALTQNGQAMDSETASLISGLLANKKVAIISGCGYPRFETQFLKSLPPSPDKFANLFLLPVSGTKLMSWKGTWCESYSEHLSPQQKQDIMMALNAALRTVGWKQPEKSYGAIIQDRESQITFSALGENASAELKAAWDPARETRTKIVSVLQARLPNYDIRIGGLTSIDITKRGVNKAFGVRKLEELLKLGPDAIEFVGDCLFSGGNDFPVKAAGIDCTEVKGPEEVKALLKSWVA